MFLVDITFSDGTVNDGSVVVVLLPLYRVGSDRGRQSKAESEGKSNDEASRVLTAFVRLFTVDVYFLTRSLVNVNCPH